MNLDNLNIFEQEYVKEMMKQMDKGDMSLFNNIFADDYRYPLVTPLEFLHDPQYTGDFGKQLFPRLKEDFCKLFTSHGIFEVILAGSQRWGKNYFAENAAVRMMYEILSLKKPQEFFGISSNTDIYIAVFSVNATKAKSEFYDGVKRIIDNSPFFSQFRLRKDLESRVTFKLGDKDDLSRGNLVFVSGNSSELSAFGQNTIAGFLDEANFLPDIKNSKRARSHGREDNHYNAALNLYQSVYRRMKNTYGTAYGTMPGKFFIISSQKHEKDFVNNRIREVNDTKDKSVFVLRYASWDTNPKYKNAERFTVGINHKVNKLSKILSENDIADEYERIIKPPKIFWFDFVNDFFGAMCDLAGQPFYGKGKFINSLKIPMIFNKIIHPFCNKDKVDFSYDDIVFDKNKIQYKNKPRFIHLDMAESGDNLGIAMGYLYGSKKVTKIEEDKVIEIDMPITAIDFMLTVVPPKEGKIDIDKIYQLMLRLKNLGLYINKITYDRFQTTYLMQRLAKIGFNVEYLSLDRLPCEPYYNLRDSIHQERLYSIDNDIIGDELGCLEKTETGKIDHDAEGSKDLGDCIGGVNHSVLNYFINCDFGNKPLIDTSDRQLMQKNDTGLGDNLSDFDGW